MKIVISMLIGAIGSVGCTTVGHHLDNVFPQTVKTLSPGVERELGEIVEIDVKDIALILPIDKKNRTGLLKSKHVIVKNAVFPIKTTEIKGSTSISVVSYNRYRSDCTIIEINGASKAFCRIRGRMDSVGTKSEHSSVADSKYPIAPYPPVKILSQKAERELDKMGVKEISLALAIEKKGGVFILRSTSVMDESDRFPIKATEITEITPITVVNYKGSDCIVLIDGGMPRIVCPDPNSPE